MVNSQNATFDLDIRLQLSADQRDWRVQPHGLLKLELYAEKRGLRPDLTQRAEKRSDGYPTSSKIDVKTVFAI